MSVLKKIRVVEFAEGVPGPLAALRLSNLGADVIKVEIPQGDWLRNAAPSLPDSDMSAAYFELNRGKRSVVLDDKVTLSALLKNADVFITDRTTEQLAALGVADIEVEPYAANPKLVRIAISPWGDRGPLKNVKGSELAAQAMAGYTRYLGSRDAPACRLGADVACAGTGIFVVQATLAALIARAKSGVGQRVTLSLLNSLLALKSIHLAAQSDPDVYAGPRVGGANYPPERGWKTKDEPIFFAFGGSVGAEGRPGWVKFCEEAGFNGFLTDERFDKIGRDSTGYGVRVPELRPEYEREFARYSAEELVAMIRKHAGNAASYQRADQALGHAQTQALGVVREVPAANGAMVKVRAFPARFSKMQLEVKGAAPTLGEHTLSVTAELRA